MKWMKKIMAALLVAAFCLSMLTALAESGMVWTTGNVNMRKGPGLDYGSIRTISAGVGMEFDKTSTDDRGVKWYRITYKGRTGWISSRYSSQTKPATGASSGGSSSSAGKVRTTASVNLRKGPGKDYSVIRTVPEGVSLNYDKTAKDDRGVTWYRVTYKKRTGWVSSMYASAGGSTSGSSGGSSSASSGKVKTTASVHLRSGAGLDYKSLCTIEKGVSMKYDETKKDGRGVTWYHVSYNGTSGWVSSKYAKRK